MNMTLKTHAAASITREAALLLSEAAREAAANLGIEVAIAVSDAAGHLKAFERADRAPFLTAEVAIDKAWTAASFGVGTHVWNQILDNSQVAQLAHRPRLVAVGGGYPILLDGAVVGGIGVSGGNALQDQQVCETALSAAGFALAR
ncbi:GlcG/HbpS family heme-binding protein [Chromobacterium sphagni]|nr:heme-binding protein [Chromobacterium sphagni]